MNLPSDTPAPSGRGTWFSSLAAPRRARRLLSGAESLLVTLSPGERLILYILSGLLTVSALALLVGANAAVSVEVPARGGSIREGMVGSPRFVNPILATSESDKSVTYLTYSGLMRAEGGSFTPDLAASYTISEDGTTYTFTLRSDAVFHDGTPVTADDVVFTVQAAQNPDIKSPRRADWEGVTVVASDPRTVVFKLPHAYAPFLENTTLGILPKALWESTAPADFPFNSLNTKPIGSGPYRATRVETDETGAVTRYTLKSFKDFTLGEPHITTMTLRFYPNEEALLKDFRTGGIRAFAAATPSDDMDFGSGTALLHSPLARVFGIFFNQSRQSALAESAVREALDAAVNKEELIDTVLAGYGVPLEGPVPPGILSEATSSTASATSSEESDDHTLKARSLLASAGWEFDEAENVWKKGGKILSLTLATADTPELAKSAEKVASDWRAAGVSVTVHVYPLAELNTTIIRPRAYDALLFGEVVGRTPDLFAFWHSSQRTDPGLNLALYTNSKTDALLSSARSETDEAERESLYRQFEGIVKEERPAVFLYAPELLYVVPTGLAGVELGPLSSPAERFFSAHEWYLNTERVWSVFAKDR